MKIKKENIIPSFKSLKNKGSESFKKKLKENINNYITINNINEKENELIQKKTEKKRNNYIRKNNKSENIEKTEKIEKRNLSPLIAKFRNFYSLLKNKHNTFAPPSHKIIKQNNNNYMNIKTIKKNEDNSMLNGHYFNIKKIDLPLNFQDINCKINEQNKIDKKENQLDSLIYLKTTNGIKNINSSFFYSSKKKLINIQNPKPKLCQNILYRNIIKKSPTIQYEHNDINKTKENNKLNLPSINSKKKNININMNEIHKITPINQRRPLIRKLNKNNTFLNYSNNYLDINPQLMIDNIFFNQRILLEENDNIENKHNIIPIKDNINNTNINFNKTNNLKQDLKFRNRTKIYSLRKNYNLNYLYDIPPVNYYKDDFYYYNIYPSNCGWLIKNCFKHRLKWRECHCNNTNLYNFKWKEVLSSNNDFLDLSQNKIQIINHFEFQSCISNKYKMFYNFSKYCEENNINVFKYLPFTIVIDVSNFSQFLNVKQNFKKIFDNIDNYLFDINSINNKIFDRKKISYKSLFPMTDSKLGIKLYCEIPKSHFNGKNLWIVKAPNLNRGRCVKVFNNYNKIFSYIKKITEGKADEYDINIDDNKKEDNPNNKDNNNNNNNNNKKEENLTSELINKNENQEEKEYKYQSSIIIIQKYIERPFLYKGRKCDIRIWTLITHKMEVYIFKEGHLKASSVNYDVDNFDSFVHLTNYSLQKYNKSFSKFEKGNEISFKIFQEFINSLENPFNFREEIFPKFIEIIKHTMLCAKNKINLNNRNYCFEIFGYDFMMDEDKNIYLIEINTNPGLEISSEIIEELVPRMIDDALVLTVDNLFPKEYDKECLNKEGKYKSKYHVNGYSDEENMWDFICDMKKHNDKNLINSFSFSLKNFKRTKKKIRIKKFKNKK